MSEALVVLTPKSLDIPPGCTLRQYKAAQLIVARKDDPTSWAEIFRQAGYAESHIRASSLVIRESDGVQRAIASITEGQRDSARQIKLKASARVLKEVSGENGDPNYALNAWATAAKVAAEYPDEAEHVGNAEIEAARLYVQRLVTFAFQALASKLGVHNIEQVNAIAVELTDSIRLAADNAELTQYPLSDCIPTPTTDAAIETTAVRSTDTD